MSHACGFPASSSVNDNDEKNGKKENCLILLACEAERKVKGHKGSAVAMMAVHHHVLKTGAHPSPTDEGLTLPVTDTRSPGRLESSEDTVSSCDTSRPAVT